MIESSKNRFAFLLSISDYENFKSYEFPDKVIKKFQDLLIDTGYYDSTSIISLRTDCDKTFQPSINKIRAKFKYFVKEILEPKKNERCQIIIYFLCHGGSFEKENYIFPKDVEPYHIEGTSIKVQWFIDQIKAIGDHWDILFIIDACRVDMEEDLALAKAKGFTKDVDHSYPAGINILWACAPGDTSKVAREKHTNEAFGIFSRALLNGLMNDLKGPVPNKKLETYLTSKVRRIAIDHGKPPQKPWLSLDSNDLGSKKVFFTCEGEETEQEITDREITDREFSFVHKKELISTDENAGNYYEWEIFLEEKGQNKLDDIHSIKYSTPLGFELSSIEKYGPWIDYKSTHIIIRSRKYNFILKGRSSKSFWIDIEIRLKDNTVTKAKSYLDLVDKSALEILERNPKAKNGIYWIQPLGEEEPFPVLCDMERDEGGWILVANFKFLPAPHAVPGWNSGDQVGVTYIDDNQDWKMSDDLINKLVETVYRVVGEYDQCFHGTGYGKITRYWSGEAKYDSYNPSRGLSRISYFDWELKKPTGLKYAAGWHFGLTSVSSEKQIHQNIPRKSEIVTSHTDDSCLMGCSGGKDHAFSLRIGGREKAGFKLWVK